MKRRWSRSQTVQLIFLILVVVFVTIYLVNIDWATLEGLELSWPPLIAASLIALGYRYWGALIWLYLLLRLGADNIRDSWRELSYVYAKSWLGRYLLGAGTWILGKIYFAAQHGVGKSKLAVSGILESVLQLIATILVGLGALALDPRLNAVGSTAVIISAIALAACVIGLIPPVFRWGISLVYKILRRKSIDPADLPDWRAIWTSGGMYIVGTIISGTSYFFIAAAVYPTLQWSDFLYVVGASSIAAAVSLLAVFAPGGIGVREGVQVLFFSALMPTELAVVISVLMRVWSLAIDGLFFGTTSMTRRLGRRKTPRSLR